MSIDEFLPTWLARYGPGTGSGLGGALCTTCMAGMYGVMAATAGTAGAAGSAGVFALLPVGILRPIAGVMLLVGLGGLWLSRHRHGHLAPFLLALPAGGYLLILMYGMPRLLFMSLAAQVVYVAAILALLASGGWDIRLNRMASQAT